MPRYALAYDGPTRVGFIRHSGNHKLGRIPVTMTTGDTCPPSCPWYGQGCYAECTRVAAAWGRLQAGSRGMGWEEFCREVERLPTTQLWRHNDAGDLPGKGENLDVRMLGLLVDANTCRRGFTYTHKPLTMQYEQLAVARANRLGFTINLSADSPAEADRQLALGIAPVVLTWPERLRRTPGGHPVAPCLAQTTGRTCDQCGSCAEPHRSYVVQILPHSLRGRQVEALAKRTGLKLKFAPSGDGRLARWEA